MPLHTYGINTQSFCFRGMYQFYHCISATRYMHIIIIIIEFGIRISLMRITECQRDKFLTQYLIKLTLAVRTVFHNSLIHDIPPFNPSFITAYNCRNMGFHTLLQYFGSDIIARIVHTKPGCKL